MAGPLFLPSLRMRPRACRRLTSVPVQVNHASVLSVAGDCIFVAGGNGAIKIFNRQLQQLASLPTMRSSPHVVPPTVSPRSPSKWHTQPRVTALGVCSRQNVVAMYADQQLCSWAEYATGSWTISWQRDGAAVPYTAVAIKSPPDSSSPKLLASVCTDGLVQVWQQQNAAITNAAHPRQKQDWVPYMAPHRLAEQVNRSVATLVVRKAKPSMAFSPCGTFLAVAGGVTGGPSLFDMQSKQKLAVHKGREGPISCLAWDMGGQSSEQILACGGETGCVIVYGVSVHGVARVLHCLSVHAQAVTCVGFCHSVSVRNLISCASDGKVACTSWYAFGSEQSAVVVMITAFGTNWSITSRLCSSLDWCFTGPR
jgi:WD40 repeat protein